MESLVNAAVPLAMVALAAGCFAWSHSLAQQGVLTEYDGDLQKPRTVWVKVVAAGLFALVGLLVVGYAGHIASKKAAVEHKPVAAPPAASSPPAKPPAKAADLDLRASHG